MGKIWTTLVALVAAVQLGGCKSFVSALNLGGPLERSDLTQPIFGAADLERGKSDLRAGRTGKAIRALQLATLNKDTASEAFNALGIAYARLGRADLAERYFYAAISAGPAAPHISANLARFYASDLGRGHVLRAQRRREAESRLAVGIQEAEAAGLLARSAQSERRGAIVLERPALLVTRESPTTLAVMSAPEKMAEPSMQIGSRSLASSEPSADKKAVVTILARAETPAGQVRSPSSPAQLSIRANVQSPTRLVSLVSPKASYPVRVSIRSASDD